MAYMLGLYLDLYKSETSHKQHKLQPKSRQVPDMLFLHQ